MSHSDDKNDDLSGAAFGEAVPRTVFSPNPGGRLTQDPGPQVARQASIGVLEGEAAKPGINALVDAGSELFDLLVYLRSQNSGLDIAPLRDKTLALIKSFEKGAQQTGEAAQIVKVAKYAIAATIDDQIMSKPWGTECGWQHATLVGAIGGEKIGGDRFFELLEQAESDPQRFQNLIEFMYICLSLGFQGRYRHTQRQSMTQLDSHRKSAFLAIEGARKGFADRLSLRWSGVETVRLPVRDLIPVWLVASLSILVCAGLFVTFLIAIGGMTSTTVSAMAKMPYQNSGEGPPVVEITRLAIPAPKEEVIIAPPRIEVVQKFLEAEIIEGLVEVVEDRDQIRIRLIGETMFGAGKAVVLEQYKPVLRRVAVALNDRPGDVLIEGHTDSIPIKTARFPSNFHLSEERARAAAQFVLPLLKAPDRVMIIGYGATIPIAENSSSSGRARNRRIEILLSSDIYEDQG